MSAVTSLLVKDAREHGVTAVVLAVATLATGLVSLGQNASAAFSMSPFEVVRFALLTYLPMAALIVGNRLIVREYLAGTRLFVEALPLGQGLPLMLKYLLGFGYLALLVLALVLIAAQAAGLADDVTRDYVVLMLGKSLAVVALYWSIVFCFSLCGHLRLMLYAALIGLVLLILRWPGIDASRFAPFALLDDQLFVFERDVVPWAALLGTLLLAFGFSVAGFGLARVGEGSVAERLARPMTRRDMVAFGVLLIGGLGVVGTLVENNPVDVTGFAGQVTIRSESPQIAVHYREPRYRADGIERHERLRTALVELQAALGVVELPPVRLALTTELAKNEVRYATADGVRIGVDWRDHDDYDGAVLDAVILHGVLGSLSGERATFAPEHWLLDGLSRWWAEQRNPDEREAHEAELIARAWHAVQRSAHQDLIDDWQLIADGYAYPTAEAMAWSAIHHLEQTAGRDAVLALARARFGRALDNTALASFQDRRRTPRQRFEEATGQSWAAFDASWRAWLAERVRSDDVQTYLKAIPALQGRVRAGYDSEGVYHLLGDYLPFSDADADSDSDANSDANVGVVPNDGPSHCVMKHDLLGPFDNEFDVEQRRDDRLRHEADCALGAAVHDVGSLYAPGQRVYVGFDLEDSVFHQPLRLNSRRVDLRNVALEEAHSGSPVRADVARDGDAS